MMLYQCFKCHLYDALPVRVIFIMLYTSVLSAIFMMLYQCRKCHLYDALPVLTLRVARGALVAHRNSMRLFAVETRSAGHF